MLTHTRASACMHDRMSRGTSRCCCAAHSRIVQRARSLSSLIKDTAKIIVSSADQGESFASASCSASCSSSQVRCQGKGYTKTDRQARKGVRRNEAVKFRRGSTYSSEHREVNGIRGEDLCENFLRHHASLRIGAGGNGSETGVT